jgi:hypothetical protein
MMFRLSIVVATMIVAVSLATPGWADPFSFSTRLARFAARGAVPASQFWKARDRDR